VRLLGVASGETKSPLLEAGFLLCASRASMDVDGTYAVPRRADKRQA
jgi:hypothetical protein